MPPCRSPDAELSFREISTYQYSQCSDNTQRVSHSPLQEIMRKDKRHKHELPRGRALSAHPSVPPLSPWHYPSGRSLPPTPSPSRPPLLSPYLLNPPQKQKHNCPAVQERQTETILDPILDTPPPRFIAPFLQYGDPLVNLTQTCRCESQSKLGN